VTVESVLPPAANKNAVRRDDFLASLDANRAATMLSAAADITLVISPDGVICDRVLAGEDLPPDTFIGWPGKAWADTVTVESRPKIEQLLQDAAIAAPVRWRQVNHPMSGGADLPVRYSAMQVGAYGHIVAVGRDLRPIAVLQQRLIAAEQSIEQEYARLRATETRYRLLLQVASEAILIVDARSGRIAESNPAAASLLGRQAKRLNGAVFQELFEGQDSEKIDALLTSLKIAGRADDTAVTLGAAQQQAIISAAVFRQDNTTHHLFRLIPLAAGASGVVIPRAQSKVVQIIAELPDGFVVADPERRILSANAAFLDMAQLGSEVQARGEPIERWLGRPGVDTNLMLNGIREHGSIRQFQTVMRGQFGMTEEVEVSGVSVPDGRQPCFGFAIRRAATRAAAAKNGEQVLPRSVDEMTKLVGKVPLKELVREATDIIERLCIEAALQLTGNNRASTADMLGLSRQSLYMKLHRYGIDDPGPPH
jgi:transcriptional regulator PpsR